MSNDENANTFNELQKRVSDLVAGLLEDGLSADDVSGVFVREGTAVRIVAEGRESAAKWLRDFADAIEKEVTTHGRH